MKSNMQNFAIILQALILLFISLDTVKIRWQLSQAFENQEYLKVTNAKLSEISLQLKTEDYHLNSPGRMEKHAKQILGMQEIGHAK